MNQRKTVLAAVFLLALLAVGSVMARSGQHSAAVPPAGQSLEGHVVDEFGSGIARATVDFGGGDVVESDDAGRFRAVLVGGSRLATAQAEGHLSRTQAVEPGVPTEIVLTGQAAATISLRFGGDVMFGRRYYDANDDGDRSDGLLKEGASVAEHAALLAQVRPLLEDADLTVVNLETPLVRDPWVDPTAPRPERFHPTKEFVFASALESAEALLDSGIDAVSLGNNHVYDALGPGLDSTLTALDNAGMPHFGAGRTIDEAWAPAFIDRKGERLALLACTTITGTEHAIPYVADETRGGAAQCTTARLTEEVQKARANADSVVVMVHGGEEYEAEQTDVVRELSLAAVQAGATLVIDGHPHVVGGVSFEGTAVVAETMGNLLFDQMVWPTFVSYLLRIDLRADAPVLTTIDPILLEDYVPRPAVGVVADTAARRAAGLLPGPMTLQPPGAVFAAARPPLAERTTLDVQAGTVARLAPGWWVDALPAGTDRQIRVGEDLLWTGSFEDMDTDPATSGAHLWSFGPNVEHGSDAACASATGMELLRSPVSAEDVVLTPTHRQLVASGSTLSLLVDIRGSSPGASLELALYNDTEGPSSSTLRMPIPQGEQTAETCRRVRLDAELPAGTLAVQPFVRLAAPEGQVLGAHLEVDNVRLIDWADPGSSGRLYDTIEALDDVTFDVVSDCGVESAHPLLEASPAQR